MLPSISYKKVLMKYAAPLLFVAVAMVVRDVFLDNLDGRIAWVTFYPAVMAAALYGGLWAGIVAASATCFSVVYLWDIYSHQPFIKDSGDWLGLWVFFMNGALISGMGEMSRRSKARAIKAREDAEAANRSKSIFLATMSHELRTPLNAILGFSELMGHDTTLNGEQRGAFGIINKSGVHLLNLINDILDMARVEAGKVNIYVTTCNISLLVSDVAAMMRQRAEAKGLVLNLEITLDVPHTVRIDEAKVRQVLINLTGNAIKFTSSGQVDIRLDYGTRGSIGTLSFDVRDTGTGIPADDLTRIFKPFEQVGQSCSNREGTGLGLAISHQYCELMQGELTVESVPGHGSLFHFEIPAKAIEVQSSDATTGLGSVVGLEPAQPVWRILIVEDEPANWMLLQRVLERVGLEVRVAENGQEGVAVFQEWQPHFIWMDCRMPVMDGLEATRRIRGMDGGMSVKIVALTASVFKEEHDLIMEAGMDGFMQKPIEFNAIYSCLDEQLGIRFIREQGAPVRSDRSMHFDLEALGTVNRQIRMDLREVLKSLDSELIDRQITLIFEESPELAKALGQRAKNLEYTSLLRALTALEGQEGRS